MKRLHRLDLSAKTLSFLRKRTQKVAAAANPRAEVERLWRARKNRAFQEIQEVLKQIASGIERCMYCEDSEGTAIEHFWPRAGYPERAFDWLNYLIACSGCNSNFKRDLFPLDSNGEPLLVNPTEEDPLDHLAFSPWNGLYEPRSPKGDPSIQVFGLNRPTLTRGRFDAWTSLQQILIGYARCRDLQDNEQAERIETAIRRYPFAAVFAALVRMAEGPDAELLIDPECFQVLRNNPEIAGWV